MSGLEPFQPDDDYCVYCHAVAAGLCATCGALCCPDCVELEMGWTTQRAVCHACLRERGEASPRRRIAPALLAALLFLSIAVATWFLIGA